jgi:hypothetical protein
LVTIVGMAGLVTRPDLVTRADLADPAGAHPAVPVDPAADPAQAHPAVPVDPAAGAVSVEAASAAAADPVEAASAAASAAAASAAVAAAGADLAAAAEAAEAAEAAAGNAAGLGVDGCGQRQQPRCGPQVLLAETTGQHLLAEDTVELLPGGHHRNADVVEPVGQRHES